MKHRKYFSALLALAGMAGLPAYAADDAITLTITVDGATANKGQAVLTLFTSRETFLKQPHTTRIVPIDASGTAIIRVSDLIPGIYAVNVYYDEDSNGELNTNFFGIPTGLVGFSNQAKGLLGPPSFKKASFALSADHAMDILWERPRTESRINEAG